MNLSGGDSILLIFLVNSCLYKTVSCPPLSYWTTFSRQDKFQLVRHKIKTVCEDARERKYSAIRHSNASRSLVAADESTNKQVGRDSCEFRLVYVFELKNVFKNRTFGYRICKFLFILLFIFLFIYS